MAQSCLDAPPPSAHAPRLQDVARAPLDSRALHTSVPPKRCVRNVQLPRAVAFVLSVCTHVIVKRRQHPHHASRRQVDVHFAREASILEVVLSCWTARKSAEPEDRQLKKLLGRGEAARKGAREGVLCMEGKCVVVRRAVTLSR